MKNKKSVKIILIISLVVAIVFLWGVLLKNPPYVSYGYACAEISPTQDTENYNCSEINGGFVCVSPPKKYNETCCCLSSGGCIC